MIKIQNQISSASFYQDNVDGESVIYGMCIGLTSLTTGFIALCQASNQSVLNQSIMSVILVTVICSTFILSHSHKLHLLN
ncbi:hypothetical protein BC833DRAFT_600393 [Globomyces pollinis-pini]|nr:hypothetical protein BC833DRAFT_600393 [Globomyces pollinis-pini]